MGPPWLQLALVALQLLAAAADGELEVPATPLEVPEPPPPLLDAAYFAQRGAQADRARASLSEALAQAHAQAAIAQQQALQEVWRAGPPPRGWPSAYVNLSAVPTGGPRRTSVDLQGTITLQTLATTKAPHAASPSPRWAGLSRTVRLALSLSSGVWEGSQSSTVCDWNGSSGDQHWGPVQLQSLASAPASPQPCAASRECPPPGCRRRCK